MQASADALVSAVMAVYNGADFVVEAIASVFAQTHSRIELIIVDDGSQDDTVDIVRRRMRDEPRIALLQCPHLGQAHALNAGIDAAQGEYIARIDHDDLWQPERLAVQLTWMLEHGIDVCGSWVRRFGTKSGTIRFPQSHEAILYETLFTCPILDSATTFRGDVLRANPYPPSAIVRQELVQCVALLPKYRFGNLSRYLTSYRAHEGQKTTRFASLIHYRHIQLCTQHFVAMFPHAPAEDVHRFSTLILSPPLKEPRLSEAADLFRRYLEPEDREVKSRMARRWRALCPSDASPSEVVI